MDTIFYLLLWLGQKRTAHIILHGYDQIELRTILLITTNAIVTTITIAILKIIIILALDHMLNVVDEFTDSKAAKISKAW